MGDGYQQVVMLFFKMIKDSEMRLWWCLHCSVDILNQLTCTILNIVCWIISQLCKSPKENNPELNTEKRKGRYGYETFEITLQRLKSQVWIANKKSVYKTHSEMKDGCRRDSLRISLGYCPTRWFPIASTFTLL